MPRKNSIIFAAVGLLLMSAGARAATPTLEQVLADMEKADNTVKSLAFDYAQTATIKSTGERQSLKGTVFFTRPDRFRMDQKTPFAQTVVTDGVRIWIYNPRLNQVLVDKWEGFLKTGGFSDGLSPLSMDVGTLRDKYDVSLDALKAHSKKESVLRLSPKEKSPWAATFWIWVSADTGIPGKTEMDSPSVKMETRLTHMTMNEKIKESLFHFEPPRGAEVLNAAGDERP